MKERDINQFLQLLYRRIESAATHLREQHNRALQEAERVTIKRYTPVGLASRIKRAQATLTRAQLALRVLKDEAGTLLGGGGIRVSFMDDGTPLVSSADLAKHFPHLQELQNVQTRDLNALKDRARKVVEEAHEALILVSRPDLKDLLKKFEEALQDPGYTSPLP